MEESKLVQRGLMDVETVVNVGYKGLMAGEAVVIPGLYNKGGASAPTSPPATSSLAPCAPCRSEVGSRGADLRNSDNGFSSGTA